MHVWQGTEEDKENVVRANNCLESLPYSKFPSEAWCDDERASPSVACGCGTASFGSSSPTLGEDIWVDELASWARWLARWGEGSGSQAVTVCAAAAKAPRPCTISSWPESPRLADEESAAGAADSQPAPLGQAQQVAEEAMRRPLFLPPTPPLGPLGAPAPCHPRRQQVPMSAIEELPPEFSSALYEEFECLGGEEDIAFAHATLPDPLSLGLQVGDGLLDPSPGAEIVAGGFGLGRVRPGLVGLGRSARAVLVTELRLPRLVDATTRVCVNDALRGSNVAPVREDIAAALGAVPARLADGGAGLWAAWSDPLDATVLPSRAQPLSQKLQAQTTHSQEWRLSVARRLCAALAALHGTGRSHGSLALRNVWVSQPLAAGDESLDDGCGAVSVLEAGLVDALLDAGVLREHELLSYLGLEFARYLAPEGWQVPRCAGAAADVWALGHVLLEVLGGAGRPHPECSTLQHLASKVLPKRGTQQARRITSGDSAYTMLPQRSQRVVEACLSTQPDARPSVQQVFFALNENSGCGSSPRPPPSSEGPAALGPKDSAFLATDVEEEDEPLPACAGTPDAHSMVALLGDLRGRSGSGGLPVRCGSPPRDPEVAQTLQPSCLSRKQLSRNCTAAPVALRKLFDATLEMAPPSLSTAPAAGLAELLLRRHRSADDASEEPMTAAATVAAQRENTWPQPEPRRGRKLPLPPPAAPPPEAPPREDTFGSGLTAAVAFLRDAPPPAPPRTPHERPPPPPLPACEDITRASSSRDSCPCSPPPPPPPPPPPASACPGLRHVPG